jgi:mersacidin/lichenicidin family type 2 lantibiotic
VKNFVRACKEKSYRHSLPTEEQTMLCSTPTGNIELTDAELETIYGGDGGLLGSLTGGANPLGGVLNGLNLGGLPVVGGLL